MLFYQTLICSFLAVASASFGPSCKNIPDGTNIPVKRDCTRYTTCTGENAVINTCPDQTMYSIAQRQCVLTNFSGCFVMKKYCPTMPALPVVGGRTEDSYTNKQMDEIYGELNTATIDEQQMIGFTADQDFVCPQKSGYFAVENEESSYRICVRGKAFVGKCEEGSIFDSESNICVDGRDVTDKLASLPTDFETDCVTVDQSGVYGYSKNCKLFQVCCGSVASMHKCPLGMRFDTFDNVCSFNPRCKT